MLENGELPEEEKPDRRLLLAAAEHVAVCAWQTNSHGRRWLNQVLKHCQELEEQIAAPAWLVGRGPLTKAARVERANRDPEAAQGQDDPLAIEDVDTKSGRKLVARDSLSRVSDWVARLRKDAIGDVIAPYLKTEFLPRQAARLPLLAFHHARFLAQLGLNTRIVAGQVFRRILMADEFLLRYLADVERESTERWVEYLGDRYVKPLDGHHESLRDRVSAYLETLVRVQKNKQLLTGYLAAAHNRNVVQLVQGGTQNRDRYFLGFNTPYRPEILISTSVGQEGIDLHRECRHIIHHDLCWNPATIEQRTGRVDRIGSKVERERARTVGSSGPTLEIGVPYLAATYDERMFEELYRRAQLFEVTMGGDVRVEGRVEGRIEPEDVAAERQRRRKLGIGTDDEDLGKDGDTGTIPLPADMVERLRVNLCVWKPATPS